MATGKDKFDLNNDQKFKQDNLDKSDGPIAKTEILKGHDHEHDPIAKTEILDGQPEHGNQSHVSEPTADGVIFPGNDAENYNAGTNWVKTDTPIHETEDRADADIIPGDVPKVELNQGLGKYVKDGEPGPDGPMGPPQDPQGMGLDRLGTQFDEDGMGEMHTHMDDAGVHQGPEGPPQDPQGMGLDRLGTQFDEDGMGDMHTPDDPNDGGEVV